MTKHYIVHNDQRYVVRSMDRLGAKGGNSVENIKNTVIASRDGTPILVSDVAEVRVDHAVRQGTLLRLRPILMTTLMTLLLLPTLYGWFNPETQSERAIVREVEAGEQRELHGGVTA